MMLVPIAAPMEGHLTTTLLPARPARTAMFISTPAELDDESDQRNHTSRAGTIARVPLLPVWAAVAATSAVLRFAGFMVLAASMLLQSAAWGMISR
ncbi:hypothetical protein DEI92_16135 [Curtobacterium sp. MCBD17_034]|nr:hypothetical protein DEI86_14465 [Curtobacterium sp. MCBD17_028]PZE77841.1 hypothetical protein DEI82_03330 [Curtobacterium sp. MCBD17_019]PZF55350.1 hypothetical protein DEI92_16135 [Curtobacterium sp. MCBD17_034]PZM32816.1 hypothetical protein DEI90_15945 [Curtobacterium sp. MCBD17_031]